MQNSTQIECLIKRVEEASAEAFQTLSYATSAPSGAGYFRVMPEDFFVEEQISYEHSGAGEHLWLWVEKKGENSDWVAKELAKWAGVSRKNVGMAGQKDRHAVTRQWFSITLPGKADPDFSRWQHESVTILKHIRHQRKLQRGGLQGNRFVIRLRGLQSQLTAEQFKQDLTQRLLFISQHGVPNYFGEQRFGHKGNNLNNALSWLQEGQKRRITPNQRSLYLSAIRSWVFNQYLSARVESQSWDQYVVGDALNLEGSERWFVETAEEQQLDLQRRVAEKDLHPTGLLCGEGDPATFGVARQWDEQLNQTYADWIELLSTVRMKQDRRALRLLLGHDDFSFKWIAAETAPQNPEFDAFLAENSEGKNRLTEDLVIEFSLTSGSFATMVLRELTFLKSFLGQKP